MARAGLVDSKFWRANEGNEDGQLVEKVTDRLEKGADVNAVERALGGARWTPLHFAAIYKAGPEVVALLLARGADVHAVDKDKRTALHSAATNQASADVVELLLAKGASSSGIDLRNVEAGEEHPLLAVAKASATLADRYFWHANASDEDGQLLAKVVDLLEKGADVHAVEGFSKKTALHFAAEKRASCSVVELLLEKGADVHAVDKWRSTPLHYATKNKAGSAVVELLLAKGASFEEIDLRSVSVNDDEGERTLLAAAKASATLVDAGFWGEHEGDEDGQLLAAVTDLLEKGADVHAVDNSAKKMIGVIQYAVKFRAGSDVLELLLGKGASIAGIDLGRVEAGDGQPLLAAAKARASLVDSEFWVANQGNRDGRLLAKVTDRITKGADVHAVDKDRKAALHLAMWKQAGPEVVALLLARGADVHAVDKDKRTALHLAVTCKAGPKVVELLLEKGASSNGIDLSGLKAGSKQPLLAAEKAAAVATQAIGDSNFWKANQGNRDGQLLAKVTGLLNEGADVHVIDEYKRMALHYAVEMQAGPEVVELLLEKGASSDGVDLRNVEAGRGDGRGDESQPLLAAAKARASLVDDEFWSAHEGNKDGQLLAKVVGRLEKGADVHAVDGQMRTALHFAAWTQAGPEVAGLLLAMGAKNTSRRSGSGDPILSPEQEHEARFALASFMRSDESFLRRVVDPRDLPLIDTYVDALASAPEEIESESESESKSENDGGGCSAITSSLSCPNRSARLAEARELRGQSAAFHASVAQLEASVAARKQANLEAAVCGAVGLGAGWPEALSLKEELRALVDGVAAPLLDLVTLENDQRDRPDELRIYAVSRETIMDMHGSLDWPRLEVFQDLRRSHRLVEIRLSKNAVLSGDLREKHGLLAVSSAWEGAGDPDVTGERLDAVAQYLQERPDIEHVWWDYLCMPQETNAPDPTTGEVEHPYPTTYAKNAFDELYFSIMVNKGGVNLIYLGAYVLSIVNESYLRRFWTQYEFFLGTRRVTGAGFTATRTRLDVKCTQGQEDALPDEQSKALFAKWTHRTTAEAKAILAESDSAQATKQSDKDSLLGTLAKLEAEYGKRFKALPEDVRERILWEQKWEETGAGHGEAGGGGGGGGGSASGANYIAEESMEALRAQVATVKAENAALKEQAVISKGRLAASEAKLAKVRAENSALKKEIRVLSPTPTTDGKRGKRVAPVF